ncbi:hypothetical protein KOI35_15535 [Actinoplanes bogorensis]|uniref:DUF1877 family protein n=2 Tax=Paractinoplanes bogorensis TaxID=1610840 RepID=A0ABS5YN78_9ACTN|nr:hypothetical protein [Actinoplanes bogorensis]
MGVLYDYFRAPSLAQVRAHMDENDAHSPVPGTFDGIELKNFDPGVVLGRLVGFVTGQEWNTELVRDRLIWPEGAEQDMEYEGPWVVVLPDGVRDILAGIPAERMTELAERWAAIDELSPHADPEFMRELVSEFAALAARARENDDSLFCWMSL